MIRRAAPLLALVLFVLLALPRSSDIPTAYSPVASRTPATTEAPSIAIPSGGSPATPGSTGATAPGRSEAPAASLSGIASWYSWRPAQAAAGPALRAFLGPKWRWTTVRVCAGSRCVIVWLSDFMRADRLIDLDSRSFAQLAPLSRGLLRVTVRVLP